MNINLSGPTSSIGRQISRTMPYYLFAENQITVNLVLVNLLTVLAPIAGSYTLYMVNRSPGAQIIRIGGFPAFGAPNSGVSLLPTDAFTLWNVATSIFAISDVAGGLLDCQIWYQN